MSKELNLKMVLAKCIQLAANAHAGQVDKGGQPYIFHPIRVMNKMTTDETKILAILHDVIEDTSWTMEDIATIGVPFYLRVELGFLTRHPDQSYQEYIGALKVRPLAPVVKLGDLEDNMDITRLSDLTDKDIKRLNKYATAYKEIKAQLKFRNN